MNTTGVLQARPGSHVELAGHRLAVRVSLLMCSAADGLMYELTEGWELSPGQSWEHAVLLLMPVSPDDWMTLCPHHIESIVRSIYISTSATTNSTNNQLRSVSSIASPSASVFCCYFLFDNYKMV